MIDIEARRFAAKAMKERGYTPKGFVANLRKSYPDETSIIGLLRAFISNDWMYRQQRSLATDPYADTSRMSKAPVPLPHIYSPSAWDARVRHERAEANREWLRQRRSRA